MRSAVGSGESKHLPKEAGPAVDISLEIVATYLDDFGGHVTSRADIGHFVHPVASLVVGGKFATQAKVKEFDFVVRCETNVVRFQITKNDAMRMQILEGRCELQGVFRFLLDRRRPIPSPFLDTFNKRDD